MTQKYYDLGGTIRSCKAQATMARVKPHLTTMGITRLANITGLDTIGIPTFICMRPNSKHLSVSQGKGLTPELAAVSALMEAIEGYHAENPEPPHLFGSYDKLKALHSLVTPQIFNSGFFQSENLTQKAIAWIKAQNLLTQKECLLPHGLVCLDTSSLRQVHGIFEVSSNGLASGNCIEEAICHSLYEIIERDALCQFYALNDAQRERLEISPQSITKPDLAWLIKRYQDSGLSLKIWDLTTALQIPTFCCQIQDQNELRWLGSFTGSGTHLAKEIALSRALTEAAQSRLTLISGSRDDVFPEHYNSRLSFDRLQAQRAAAQTPQSKKSPKDFATCVQPQFSNSFAANIKQILAKLVAAGTEHVYLVDHTKPQFKIAVVQVFVVGMRCKK